ncbi:uncharacterized protein LOC121383256 isoform X3 [Gigantopelta aegis]|uniref:uncharacterized protein LOC121383256 isoform X3 n=1 Tax=Gigantopelta aegis TaxID=1735272 RepID=UPI001B88B891|nr:uncharacterized protein LOC121383256 isoform X3 [Gigantopelta aegis]
MDKQYSIQFFTKFVEAMQKFCRDYIEFEQAVELSGYLSLEIDNYKKERYVLSEMVHSTGDVISESYCVKAFKTMKRLPVRNSNSDSVLRDHTNTRRSSGSRDLQDSPDHQTSSYNSRTATAGYSITSSSPASSHRHNVPSSRRPPSFAAGGPGQMGEGQNRPMNIAMQIQPRQSQFSSSGMSCDDAVIVSVQTGDTVMGSMGRSSDNAVRAQKRNIPQSEESPIHKKDKLDTDIESLYSAATSIVPTSESDVMKDSYSTTPGPSTSQNDLNPSVSEPSQSADGKEHSESIRLPIPESVTIKEENDIVFLDSPQDDSNNDFDGSQMEGGYGMDDSSHGSQGAMGGTAEDQEMNAHTARKTKAHVKLFQEEVHIVVKLISERRPPIEWDYRLEFYNPANAAVTKIIKDAIGKKEDTDVQDDKDLHTIIMTYFRTLRVQWQRRLRGSDVVIKVKQRRRQRLINKRNRRRAALLALASRTSEMNDVDKKRIETSLNNMSYMSSEESSDSDDSSRSSFPRHLTVHPLPWRSQFLSTWYTRLDAIAAQKQMSGGGGCAKIERKMGSKSKRPPPENCNPWALKSFKNDS